MISILKYAVKFISITATCTFTCIVHDSQQSQETEPAAKLASFMIRYAS